MIWIDYFREMFFVVIGTLGFATVNTQIALGTQRQVRVRRDLNLTRQVIPQIVYICIVLVLLRVLELNATLSQSWVLLNLQLVVLLSASMLVDTFGSFLLIQVVGALLFATTNALTLKIVPFYFLSFLLIYSMHWYGEVLNRHPSLLIVPPMIVGAIYWTVIGMYYQPRATVMKIVVNYVGFVWAYLAFVDYDQYQQKDQRIVAKLTREVQYDALTQARNWGTFQSDLNDNFARQTERPALIVFDIDYFKSINDTYGHLTGNQVLITLSGQMMQFLQSKNTDYQFYRTGGEEFAIVMPDTTIDQATEVVKACQQLVRQMVILTSKGDAVHITCSFGVTLAQATDPNPTAQFKRADHYLYQAKREGRDCTSVEGTVLAE